jgi:hypothetical protein
MNGPLDEFCSALNYTHYNLKKKNKDLFLIRCQMEWHDGNYFQITIKPFVVF